MVEVERDSWKSSGLTLLLEWGPRITSLWLLKINKYHRLMEENPSNRDRKKKIKKKSLSVGNKNTA